jgi:hypothetical protein
MRKFMEAVTARRTLSGPEDRMARKFALVYAGLCIGRRAKVLPLSKAEVLRAVICCFVAMLDRQHGEIDDLLNQRRRLRVLLRDERKIPKLDRGQTVPAGAQGFRREKDGLEVAYVKGASIAEALELDDEQLPRFVEFLRDRGDFELGSGGQGTRPVKIAGRPVRYYAFKSAFYARRESRGSKRKPSVPRGKSKQGKA